MRFHGGIQVGEEEPVYELRWDATYSGLVCLRQKKSRV